MSSYGRKPRRQPSVRAIQTAKDIIRSGGKVEQSLLANGYSYGTARKQPPTVMEPIRELVLEALTRNNLGLDRVLGKIDQRLESQTLKDWKTDGESNTVEVEDNQSQLRAVEILVDILGIRAPKEVKVQNDTTLNLEDKRQQQRLMWSNLGGIE